MLKQNCSRIAKFVFISLVTPLFFVAYFNISKAHAQTSTTINFQGKIVRNDTGYEGLNVTDGSPACVVSGADTCDFQVKYYSASTSGTLFLTETYLNKEIGAYGGVFDLSLGGGTPTAGMYSNVNDMIQAQTSIYVEILFAPGGAGSYTEVFTRMPLEASPYAIKSKYSSEAAGAFKFENAANATGYTGSNGMIYYDTTEAKLKLYSGGSWVDLATGGSSVWGTGSISSFTHTNFLEDGSSITTLSNFGVDATQNRAWIHGSGARTGFSVYSSYSGTTDWPLVSFKAEGSNFSNSVLRLIQDGTGNILEAYMGSDLGFVVDNSRDLHLASDGILYFETFSALPASGDLSPASGEGCLYTTGGNLYWDASCNASAPTMLNATSSSLWTDAGTFSYLTSTTDDLVLGDSTIAGGTFVFDMDASGGSYFEIDSGDNLSRLFTVLSNGNVGIGTASPGAKLEIGGSNSTITNATGNITISPQATLSVSGGGGGYAALHVTKQSAETSSDVFGINSEIMQEEAGGITVYGYRTTVSAEHSTGTLTGVQANSTIMNFYGGGTTAYAEGFTSNATVYSGTTVSYLSMMRIFSPSNSGTITNLKGIQIGNMNAGSTSNYSIYSEGGTMYHAGNVGIGTNDPNGRLHVIGGVCIESADTNCSRGISSLGSGDLVVGDASSTVWIDSSGRAVYHQYAGTSGSTQLIGRRSNGTMAAPTTVLTGDDTYMIRGFAYAGSTTPAWVESTRITFDTEGTIGDSIAPGILKFIIADSAGAMQTRMVINSTGQIGILDATPSYTLDVNGLIRVTTRIEAKETGSYGSVALTSGSTSLPGYIQWRLPAADGALGTRLGYMGWDATNVTLTLENSAGFHVTGGNVGIGTIPTSSYYLDVGGYTRINGNLTGRIISSSYSNLYRWGGLYLTWDSYTYGTNTHHSIRSTYGDTYGDSITLNSFNNFRINIDSNADNGGSQFEIGYNTTGTGNVIFALRDKDTSGYSLGGYTATLNTNNCYTASCGVDGLLINGNGWNKFLVGTAWAGAYNGIFVAQDSGIIFSLGTQNTGGFVIAPHGGTGGLRVQGSNGYVGIGTNTPDEQLTVNYYAKINDTSSNAWFTFRQYFTSGTYIEVNTPSGYRAIATSASSIEYKKNVTDLEIDSNMIYNLRPVSFNWKTDEDGTEKTFGLIAQEVEPYIPELIRYRENGEILTVAYEYLGVLNLKELQKHEAEINEIQAALTSSDILPTTNATIITNGGWYRVAETNNTIATGRIRISNTSMGSSQNTMLQIDVNDGWSNINVVSNFTSGSNIFSKARIAKVGNISYLEIFIENSDANKIMTKLEGEGWRQTGIITNSTTVLAKEYSLNGVVLGISDNLTVTKEGLTTSGTISTTGLLSDIGNTTNRWNDIYTKGTIRLGSGDGEGGIRYNIETKRLEFSNDGLTWVEMGDLNSNMVLSPEYSGAILYADGTDNYGRMTSDAIQEGGTFQNYYQWVSDKDSLQDYDILVKITLPSDFGGWNEDAISLDFMTENSASTTYNNVGISLVGKTGVDTQVIDGISTLPANWERMSIKSSEISECNKSGDSCTLRISMSSKDNYFVRVGDITLNYNRSL